MDQRPFGAPPSTPPPPDRAAEGTAANRRHAYAPFGLSLGPGPQRTLAVLVIGIPLLLILLLSQV